MKKCTVVAEIGCNHLGDLDLAKKMIKVAADCGADYAKFQKRNIELLYGDDETPHPDPWNAYGRTYREHREKLEFSIDQHAELKECCEKNGIGYSCSVWDHISAQEIMSLSPNYIKIPSACNMDFKIYDHMINYAGDIHISLGMTKREEIYKIVNYFKDKSFREIIFYHCTSDYPAKFEDLYIKEIQRLKNEFEFFTVGYSGHNYGIAVDIAAYALGAEWIERHFTLDRTFKGTDHAASLEPAGLQKLCRDLKATRKALQYKKSDDILDCEKKQRQKLKKIYEHQEP